MGRTREQGGWLHQGPIRSDVIHRGGGYYDLWKTPVIKKWMKASYHSIQRLLSRPPGCWSQGATEEEAVANIQEAIRGPGGEGRDRVRCRCGRHEIQE
jgi:hypothetical protein